MGEDELLRFLAENTKERHSPKQSAEDFADILYRHLYSPGPPSTWEWIISDNRILNTVCYRSHVWELATTAMTVSPSMQRCWVTQAGSLKDVAKHAASKVRRLHLR